jgi:hypothetical protein
MNKLVSGLSAAAVTGLLSLSAVAPASAQSFSFGFNVGRPMISSYCDRYPNAWDCRDVRFQPRHRIIHRGDVGSNLAAGILGFTAGALVASNLSSSHVRRCEAQFRSYDRRTDTYMGFDGNEHYCNL